MSYLYLLDQESLFTQLLAIDLELWQRVREQGCPKSGCGGPLHDARYTRKPRGNTAKIPDGCCRRLSLCCGHCRRRTLPPSCLFMGRKVYWSCAVMLVTAAVQQASSLSACIKTCGKQLGVSRQTVRRWVDYFARLLPKSALWQTVRGRISPDV